MSSVLGVRLSPEQKQSLEYLSKVMNTDVSTLVRKYIIPFTEIANTLKTIDVIKTGEKMLVRAIIQHHDIQKILRKIAYMILTGKLAYTSTYLGIESCVDTPYEFRYYNNTVLSIGIAYMKMVGKMKLIEEFFDPRNGKKINEIDISEINDPAIYDEFLRTIEQLGELPDSIKIIPVRIIEEYYEEANMCTKAIDIHEITTLTELAKWISYLRHWIRINMETLINDLDDAIKKLVNP